MVRAARGWLGLWLPMLAAGYLAYLPVAGRFTWGVLILTLSIALLLGWYAYGELTLPREPLGDDRAELRRWVETMAADEGLAVRRLSVVAGPAGEFEVPEMLPQSGELVFADGELERHPLSTQLALAARQLGAMTAPPRYPPAAAGLVGAALGALAGLHHRFAAVPWMAAVVLALLIALLVIIAWRLTAYHEVRSERIRHRGAEILARLRDRRPEAFADLAARQGLAPTRDDRRP